MPKTGQTGPQRRGYVNAKHNAEGQRVKAMKQEAYKGASEYKEHSRSDNPLNALTAIGEAYKNAQKMSKAQAAERSHEKMRRVRYGDNLTASGAEKK